METARSRQHPFVAYMQKLTTSAQRPAVAPMRGGRCEKPGSVVPMHRYGARFLSPERPWDGERFYLVGALLAWHP